MYQAPSECPTCQSTLSTTELTCGTCGTRIQGEWASSPFSQLNPDQQAFLILFVRSRGNLSEVERALGVSYPTVRAKLEELIAVLSETPVEQGQVQPPVSSRRQDVLKRVERGELSTAEALELLKRSPGSEGDDD